MEVLYYKDYKKKNIDHCIVDFLINHFDMNKDFIFYHVLWNADDDDLISILKTGIFDSNLKKDKETGLGGGETANFLFTQTYIENQPNDTPISLHFTIILDGYELLKDKVSYWSSRWGGGEKLNENYDKFDYKTMNYKPFRDYFISKIKKERKEKYKKFKNKGMLKSPHEILFRAPLEIKKYIKCIIIYKENRDICFVKPDIKISLLKKILKE